MGKKFIALFLCMSLLVCSALTGCSTNTTADGHEVKIIRVAFNQNEDHPQYKAMRELGDKFEEATNGRYKMVIYPNGVLGVWHTTCFNIRLYDFQFGKVLILQAFSTVTFTYWYLLIQRLSANFVWSN